MTTDHEMRMEALRLFEENERLVKALKSLTNEVNGIWDAFEYGIRQEISNTNYAVVLDKLKEAQRALDAVGTGKQP